MKPAIEGTCSHCGMLHQGICPRVRAVEYYPDGTIKAVHYHDWSAKPSEPLKHPVDESKKF